MEFFASAPCKAILFGEHYVVYGAPALAIPIAPRNMVKFSSLQSVQATGGMLLHSSLGKGAIASGCAYAGEPRLSSYATVAREILHSVEPPSLVAEFLPAWSLKGVGLSASLFASFAAGLSFAIGRKISPEEIFLASQSGDLLAHGGRASGIDAKTVSIGRPLSFTRSFFPPSYEGKIVKFSLPSGTMLMLVDTNAGKMDGTDAMLQNFARSFSITTSPEGASEEKREAVRAEYAPLWPRALEAMKGKDAKRLGALMNENHELLARRGVSSDGINRAVTAALTYGAYGAKLTGGGGEGGAALALTSRKGAKAFARKITAETGFACHAISLARQGAKIDK
jgi:mevalonate kinase